MSGGPVLLAAGGTGASLPAEALAHVLEQRGVAVELVTDERALRYGTAFRPRDAHDPLGDAARRLDFSRVAAVARLGFGVVERWRALAASSKRRDRLWRLSDRAAAGRGLAAAHSNRAARSQWRDGKANRFLAGRVDAIAAGFPLPDAPPRCAPKSPSPAIRSGPTRSRRFASLSEIDGRLRLLVTGGSQGARVMADVVPAPWPPCGGVAR